MAIQEKNGFIERKTENFKMLFSDDVNPEIYF